MFITKRHLEILLREREKKVHQEHYREESIRNQNVYIERRFDDIEKRLRKLEGKKDDTGECCTKAPTYIG